MTAATTPKGERRRQALVAAAAELLCEGGFDAVRHRSVATRADLPLASTTYYFASLDDLVARAVEFTGTAEVQDMLARTSSLVRRRRGAEATAELLADMFVGHADMQLSSREQLLVRYERYVASARHPELREVQSRLRAQRDDVLGELLRRCGRIVRVPELRKLVAVVDGTILATLCEGGADPRELVRAALLDVVDVFAPPVVRG